MYMCVCVYVYSGCDDYSAIPCPLTRGCMFHCSNTLIFILLFSKSLITVSLCLFVCMLSCVHVCEYACVLVCAIYVFKLYTYCVCLSTLLRIRIYLSIYISSSTKK